MTNTVLYSRTGHIGRLVLNNPEQFNVLDIAELEAIQGYLTAASEDEQLRVLIVTGTGTETFCAGLSLQHPDSGEDIEELFRVTTEQLAALPVPTICSLNGDMYNAGVELALSCDFRIGIEGTHLRVSAAAIGLCYSLSGINRIVERLGVNLARRILVGSEDFEANELLAIGFLDLSVLPGRLEARAEEMAKHIAGLAPLATRAMKSILQRVESASIDLDSAKKLAKKCRNSSDHLEGLAAQSERRHPRFSGK